MFSACGRGKPQRIKPFITNLSTEEHIANITLWTEARYAEEIANGTITAFQVYTMWSFKEQPEYFLIEFDGDFGDSVYVEKQGYAYLDGYIVDDRYYAYGRGPGKSPFREQGFENEKKYYGFNVMAIKKEGNMICISSSNATIKVKPGDALSKKRQHYLATHDYRLSSYPYLVNENEV